MDGARARGRFDSERSGYKAWFRYRFLWVQPNVAVGEVCQELVEVGVQFFCIRLHKVDDRRGEKVGGPLFSHFHWFAVAAAQ